MTDRFILSPSILGDPAKQLEPLAQPAWQVNKLATAGDAMARMATVQRGIGDLAFAALRANHRPVCVNGDCCAAIGLHAALQRTGIKPVLLWLDAHGDFNTWQTTLSGFVPGMSLAMLAGRGDRALLEAADAQPIAEADVVLADARDLDPLERALLESSAVTHAKSLGDAASAVRRGRPIWIHFDMDIIDPADAPAALYPAPGGPTRDQMLVFARNLAAAEQIVAMSATVWNVTTDTDGRTGETCMSVLHAFLGG